MSHTETYRRLLESIAMYSKKMLSLLEHGAGDLPQWANDLISESRTHIADVTHFLRGQANHGIRYGAANHGRAYMATANLRQIHQYANECLGDMKKDAGHFPAWVENKISVVAEYMDLIGHWLENEGAEGRKYGAHQNHATGDASDVALYRGRADGITGQHRNPYSPNSFQRKIYEQGFEETSSHPAATPAANSGDGGMGRGRGRRRRHRRNGIQAMPFWNIPVHPKSQNGEARSYSSPGVKYQPGYGSMAARGLAPTVPMDVSGMEFTMPPSRMVEPTRMVEQSRMLWHQTGRRFGVPGFRAGTPGWAGAGGVAQMPHPSGGMREMPDRTFGPGLSAGQGGVQTFSGGGGGGPMGVQTYGSMGRASMGDGSMDMAARGGRQYAAPTKSKRSKRRRKKGKKMTRRYGRSGKKYNRRGRVRARVTGSRGQRGLAMAPTHAGLTENERINKIKSPQACNEAGYVWNSGWNMCIPVEN